MFSDEQLNHMVPDPEARENLKSYLLNQKKLIEGRDTEIKKLRDIMHDYEGIAVENKRLLKLIDSADPYRWFVQKDGMDHLATWVEKMTKLLAALNKKR